MTTLIIHGPVSFFVEKISAFLEKRLLKGVMKERTRNIYLKCILYLVRGRYIRFRSSWLPFSEKRRIEDISLYNPNSLVLKKHPTYANNRLFSIVQTLFSKKTHLTRVQDYIEILVQIMTQIAAHRFSLF